VPDLQIDIVQRGGVSDLYPELSGIFPPPDPVIQVEVMVIYHLPVTGSD
jgi:hypothetical protein